MMKELERVIKVDGSIEEIRWDGYDVTEIGDEGAIKLAKWLKYTNKSLRVLSLQWNNICEVGAKAIAEALEGNKTLKELNLCGNKIDAEGCKEFAQMLKANASIISLDLGGNSIGNEGAIEIATNILSANATLTNLDLSWNSIGDEGAKEIAKILTTNSTLISLNLFSNCIYDEGAKEILSSLASSPYFSLSYLGLENNPISSSIRESISSIVKNNKLMADSLKDDQLHHPPANLSTENHIRCYNLPLSDLTFETLSNENKWLQITTIFIYQSYGTEFNDSFLSKWVSSSSLSTSNQIFSSITTLTFIKSGVISCDFLRNFPKLQYLNLSHNENLDISPLFSSLESIDDL